MRRASFGLGFLASVTWFPLHTLILTCGRSAHIAAAPGDLSGSRGHTGHRVCGTVPVPASRKYGAAEELN